MAKFKFNLPSSLIKEIEKLEKNAEKTCGEMVKAGAEVVYKNVLNNLPPALKKSNFKNCVYVTKVYKTPSDGAINDKIMVIDGYFTNHEGKKTPAPLVANLFEYGRHNHNYPSHPFFRKSFKKKQITDAFYLAFVKATGGAFN